VAEGASSSVVISFNKVTDNKANDSGCAIAANAKGVSSDVKIVTNVVTNNKASKSFSGIMVSTFESAVSSSIIISNNLVYDNGNTDDSTGGWAGGIGVSGSSQDSKYLISNNHVHNNTDGATGGMFLAFHGTITQVPKMSVDVFNNLVESNYGGWCGGIYFWQISETGYGAKVTSVFKNNIIKNNKGGKYASSGGLEVVNSQATVQNNLISGNQLARLAEDLPLSERAGGLLVTHQGYEHVKGEGVTIANNTIENNTERGVWIYANTNVTVGKASILRNIVRNNTANNTFRGHGGGVAVVYTHSDIFNNLIVGNKAPEGNGGGIFASPASGCPITIANNTIVSNLSSANLIGSVNGF
jgi:hypothetical protein